MDASLESCLGLLSSKTLRGCKFLSPKDNKNNFKYLQVMFWVNGYLCNEKEKWDFYKVHEFPDIAGLCLLSNIGNFCAFLF